jgi:putative GTP pyrophosphokinase
LLYLNLKMSDKLLEDYELNKGLFTAFTDRMVSLLKDLIETEKIVTHQISGRTKTIESLKDKINSKQNKYESLNHVTDIVGIRIITYLESDVDLVGSLIEKEFQLDKENTIDKRILKADQFGYKSLHLVVSLNEMRSQLKELAAFKEIIFEIQIRSILQHAWAEIEHDLGYKGKGIPDPLKRTFNRLSALLETADLEFVRLKNDIIEYEKKVSELIINEPENVDINKASLYSFLRTNSTLIKATKIIRSNVQRMIFHKDHLESISDNFLRINITTIKQIETILKNNEIRFLRFVRLTYSVRKIDVSKAAALYVLLSFIALSNGGLKGLKEYCDYNEWLITRDELGKFFTDYKRSTKNIDHE